MSTSGGNASGPSVLHGARIFQSAAESNAGGLLVVTFDSKTFDTDGYHSLLVNTSRITIPALLAGYYRLSATLKWAASAVGDRGILFYKNGAQVSQGCQVYANQQAGDATVISHEDIISLAGGDYVEVYGSNGSGGALNLLGDAGGTLTFFSAVLSGIV